jgi:hypothetical protein
MIRLAFAIALTMLPPLAQQASSKSPISLETLTSQEEYSGCGMGCTLVDSSNPNHRMVFSSDLTVTPKHKVIGSIRINGKLFRVLQGPTKWKRSKPHGLNSGDQFTEVWKGDSLTVRFECKLTGTNIEGEDFEGTMTINLGSSSETFQVTGYRGC